MNENPPTIEDHTGNGCRGPSPREPSVNPAGSVASASTVNNAGSGGDFEPLARLFADALKDSVAEIRRDDEARTSQLIAAFQQGLSEFHQSSEEILLTRLEKAFANRKPPKPKDDPTMHFWTTYKKVADEYDSDLVSKYVGDLDTSLVFAGLFSAITFSFFSQIYPSLEANPLDLTNVLLLRILQNNASFDGADPLAPVSTVPPSAVAAQSILFVSVAVTLLVAFVSVLGKQWILYYTRVTTWGSVVDRGKEHQAKLLGLQKWGLHLVFESLPVMLQFALLLCGVAFAIYLWEIDISAAQVSLVVTSVGLVLSCSVAAAATVWSDFPFQTPFSVMVSKLLPWARKATALSLTWLRQRTRQLLSRLARPLERVSEKSADRPAAPNGANQDAANNNGCMTLLNPALWRPDPLFTPLVPKDVAASAGFWLLENSTDFSVATAVSAAFSKFQWPSHRKSTIALTRLHDTYMQCSQAPKAPTRLNALQSAAAYYVLYHTQLFRMATCPPEVETERLPPDLPPDLLHKHADQWGGDGLFEYLLHIPAVGRSEPVTSARFLSYIAPYWFCGNSDSAIRSRPSRLQTLYELVAVLEDSQLLTPATLTECVFCVGIAMDFPLHPEDLIRIDKSHYFELTFKLVVEHIHRITLASTGCRHRYVPLALEILLHLAKKVTFPPVDVLWMRELLRRAAEENVDEGVFVLFLRLRALVEDGAVGMEVESGQKYAYTACNQANPHPLGGTVVSTSPSPEYTLFHTIYKNIETCSEHDGEWSNEALFGGLAAMRDIPRLDSCFPEVNFLRVLTEAMDQGKPFRIRKAAYDVIQAAQNGWLRRADWHQTLKDLDLPTRLHSVVIEAGCSEYYLSFLRTMEILSEDGYWHSYLRGAMGLWLPFRHDGPHQATYILTGIGNISFPGDNDQNRPLDNLLVKIVEDEWSRVPGRQMKELTIELLEPLAEITAQLKELLFTEGDRRAVLVVVERVIPSLENRCDGSYEGLGEDIPSGIKFSPMSDDGVYVEAVRS